MSQLISTRAVPAVDWIARLGHCDEDGWICSTFTQKSSRRCDDWLRSRVRLVADGMTRVLCILGMHRSGTSCLAGSLEEAGLHFGEVNTSATYNKKGNRENQRIMDLHDVVLCHNGGSWFSPPATVSWSDAHRAERDAIIRSYRNTPAWGFKDPRTFLLLDFWGEAISDLKFVGTFRHPCLVAESLCRRNGRTAGYWVDLWVNYNARLLALHDVSPFPVVQFDLGEADYRRSILMVTDRLGLAAPSRMGFFDPILRQRDALAVLQLSEGACELYRALCRIALDAQPASTASA
jgi:hypothetical protein